VVKPTTDPVKHEIIDLMFCVGEFLIGKCLKVQSIQKSAQYLSFCFLPIPFEKFFCLPPVSNFEQFIVLSMSHIDLGEEITTEEEGKKKEETREPSDC
jgi:hypothetical protein